MAKSKKRVATRNKSSSKRKVGVKRTPKMAAKRATSKRTMPAKRATSKRTKSKLRRVIQTAMEPVVQNRESTALAEPVAAVVAEATTILAVERAAPDTVVVQHESSESAPSGGLAQGALGQASP
jgi:hypothetical protein